MGADTSGNDNHFTVNNLTAIDQSTDTCTNNFATLNPLYARLFTLQMEIYKYNASTGWHITISTIGLLW